jgi:hypothetical protein
MKKFNLLVIIAFFYYFILLHQTVSEYLDFDLFINILGMNPAVYQVYGLLPLYPLYPIGFLLFLFLPSYYGLLKLANVNVMLGLIIYRLGRKASFWMQFNYLVVGSIKGFLIEYGFLVLFFFLKQGELNLAHLLSGLLWLIKLWLVLLIIFEIGQFFSQEYIGVILPTGLFCVLLLLFSEISLDVSLIRYQTSVIQSIQIILVLLLFTSIVVGILYRKNTRSDDIR